ncbi:MAG: response regulator [Elusimicrobia bacterium]|nr:response regulator [Elusimicrobiota bacterium]
MSVPVPPKVLVLDDDQEICEMSRELLERRGYTVMTALSRDEAIIILERERPQIALLDIHLSGGPSGLDVLRFARAQVPSCRCLMVSKDDRPGMSEESSRLGAEGYIRKPVTADQLEAAVLAAAEKVRREEN